MDDRFSIFTWISLVFIFIFAIFRGGFVDPEEAVRALEIQGYSNVQIMDSKWLLVGFRGCETTDATRFDMSAKNPAGKPVNLFVCVGWPFKGATVRTD